MNDLSSSAGSACPTPSPSDSPDPSASPPRPPGRPSTCTPTLVYRICTLIQQTGISDTAAGALAGVKRSTLSRWKRDEEIEVLFAQARAQYLLPRLEQIGQTRRKDGELDWRAQAWLVKYADPEVHGAPSRRRKLRDVEPPQTEEEKQAAEEAAKRAQFEAGTAGWKAFRTGDPVTPEMLTVLQAHHAAEMKRRALERAQAQAQPAAAGQPTTASSSSAETCSYSSSSGTIPAASIEPTVSVSPTTPESVTFPPETSGLPSPGLESDRTPRDHLPAESGFRYMPMPRS